MTLEVFEDIFKKYYKCLCEYCLKFVRNPVQAEEIVQEQFIILWEKNKLPPIRNMEAYLKTCVRNRAINYLQSKYFKTNFVDIEESAQLIEKENPNNILEAKELENIIGKAIDSLPERCYAVFSLKRFGVLKNKEIASKLNISEKTVENYTTLAFNEIRESIKKHFTGSIIAFVIFLYFLIGG